MRSAALDCS
ncbi:hypothetical protein VCHC17A1_3191A, partial [Vibrio cholerae HC-17A1]